MINDQWSLTLQLIRNIHSHVSRSLLFSIFIDFQQQAFSMPLILVCSIYVSWLLCSHCCASAGQPMMLYPSRCLVLEMDLSNRIKTVQAWHGMACNSRNSFLPRTTHYTNVSHFLLFVLFFYCCIIFILQAYFKFVPLEYGVPLVAGIFVIYQIHGQLKTRKSQYHRSAVIFLQQNNNHRSSYIHRVFSLHSRY